MDTESMDLRHCLQLFWQHKCQLFIVGEHFYSVLLVCGLILLSCLGDMHIRRTTQYLAAFQRQALNCSIKGKKNVKYPHTCQQGGTLHKPRAASWPSADLGQSCPRRNTPPHELWVVAPVISSKGGRNVSPLRYCRSCPSEQCTSLLERPAP